MYVYVCTFGYFVHLLLDFHWPMSLEVPESFTPMQLLLEKYKQYLHNECIYNRNNDKTYIMVQSLLQRDVEVKKSYMDVAVNFPYFLESLLKNVPENKRTEYYEILPEKVTKFFKNEFVNMGFVELMLTHCYKIILDMIDNPWPKCHAFLKEYEDNNKQMPLHSAAKLFNPYIVEKLMTSRYLPVCLFVSCKIDAIFYSLGGDYNISDKNNHTPVTIVLAKWEQLRFFASIKGDNLEPEFKNNAVEVIAKILWKIPVDDRVDVIKQKYHGMTAIEYDIKLGNGIIVEVIAVYV